MKSVKIFKKRGKRIIIASLGSMMLISVLIVILGAIAFSPVFNYLDDMESR